MESNFDFLEMLESDVSRKILMCLYDPADIVRASSVSRRWHDFVIRNDICKHLCSQLFPQLSGVARVIDISRTEGKYTDIGCSNLIEWQHLKEQCRAYTTLARGLASSKVGECLSDAISASTTDNYPLESVHNTLGYGDRIGRRASYWSSSGQSNPDVPEKLTYKLISDFCVITEINVQPFQAFWEENSPIYSAKALRFHMGYRILPGDCEKDLSVREYQSSAEEPFVWTYTSQEFPMVQENRPQSFKLPEPVLCIGGYLQVELLGRAQKEEIDGLFYICVAHVQVVGRSLSPVFEVESLFEPSGRLVLLYNPEAEFSVPRSISDRNDEIAMTQEIVQMRGWEQILDMLHGNLGANVYDSEDEHYETDEEMAEDFA